MLNVGEIANKGHDGSMLKKQANKFFQIQKYKKQITIKKEGEGSA
jgi:hypothetical protein